VGGPFGRADWLHADHGSEHVGSAGKVAEHPRRMVHFRGGLQGHLVVWDVGHEAFRVAEVEKDKDSPVNGTSAPVFRLMSDS
jgi:hypothetical protein